jgi:hypothetical protein
VRRMSCRSSVVASQLRHSFWVLRDPKARAAIIAKPVQSKQTDLGQGLFGPQEPPNPAKDRLSGVAAANFQTNAVSTDLRFAASRKPRAGSNADVAAGLHATEIPSYFGEVRCSSTTIALREGVSPVSNGACADADSGQLSAAGNLAARSTFNRPDEERDHVQRFSVQRFRPVL